MITLTAYQVKYFPDPMRDESVAQFLSYVNFQLPAKLGCVPEERPVCPPNKFWRDSMTCVEETDCTCKSHDGQSVFPSAVIKESECEICQCLNNYYTCDRSLCSKASTEKPITYPQTETITTPTSPL